MTTETARATRPVRVAYLNCNNATLFSGEAQMYREDEARLSRLLRWLQDAGAFLLPQPAELGAEGFDEVVAHLTCMLGAPFIAAGLAEGAAPTAVSGGALVAVMPIWPFEPEGRGAADFGVLLSSGRLWGADVLIEALRVDVPDYPVPVPAVRSRHSRWVRAGGGGRLRAAVQPPGRTDWYVLAALSAPA